MKDCAEIIQLVLSCLWVLKLSAAYNMQIKSSTLYLQNDSSNERLKVSPGFSHCGHYGSKAIGQNDFGQMGV
jgi:hypothetical protein